MSALAGVATVPGVTACALYDVSGERVELRLVDRALDERVLDTVMRSLSEGMTLMGAPAGQAAELFAETDRGWLLGRRLGGLFIVVTGRGPVRGAMLEVALALLSTRLRPSRGHGRRAAVPTSQRDPAPGAPVGLPVLRDLVRVLEGHLGDVARDTVRRELQQLGESPRTLTRELYPYLVERLALRVDAPDAQAAFRRAALALTTPPADR